MNITSNYVMKMTMFITSFVDLYSFDVDMKAAEQTYNSVIDAYEKLFQHLSLDVIKG